MSNGAFTGVNERRRAVLDAEPIIHLDQLGCLDLLEGFGDLLVPATVWDEVLRHRPRLLPSTVPELAVMPVSSAPSPTVLTLARTLDLDAGEIAALTLLETVRGHTFLCDDAAARLAGEARGYAVHGSIGVIVRATRRGTRTTAQVRAILQELPERSTLYIDRDLLRGIIASIPTGGS